MLDFIPGLTFLLQVCASSSLKKFAVPASFLRNPKFAALLRSAESLGRAAYGLDSDIVRFHMSSEVDLWLIENALLDCALPSKWFYNNKFLLKCHSPMRLCFQTTRFPLAVVVP
jgi:hypothetical protein